MWRFDSRSPGTSIRKTPRWPPESTGFSTAGSPTASIAERPSARFLTAANGGLRDALLGERPSHRDLVGHAVRDVASDGGKPEALRHRRDDRHGAVGGDRQRTVDLVPPRDLFDRVHVGEVDDLCDVGQLEARGGGVPVDRDDAEPPVARLGDRAALMAARADEEDAWHGGMLVEGRVWNDRHGVGTEPWPMCACCLVRLEMWGGGRRPEALGAGHVRSSTGAARRSRREVAAR